MKKVIFAMLAVLPIIHCAADIPPDVIQNIEKHVSTCSWPSLYYDVVPQVIQENGFRNVLEVGVALGGNAEAILSNCDIDTYYGVDPYKAYDVNDGFNRDVGAYSSGKIQENFDYLYSWVKDIRLAPFGDKAVLIRKRSVIASREFLDGSLDCIFIDGDHRYEFVLADLKAWYPKLRTGGVILGDDYWMTSVERAVNKFFGDKGLVITFTVSKSGYKIWTVTKTQ